LIQSGVEAGTEKILKVLNKGITLEQVEKAFKWSKKAGIETLAYFMIGSPTETREDIKETIRFAKKLKPDYVHVTILTPYPATEIYQKALTEGVIKNDYWREFARCPEKGVVTQYWEKQLSREELFLLLDRFYKEFYRRPFFILNELTKIDSFNDLKKKIKVGLKIIR